jgi:phosphoribosylanthranilate isomerase
MMVKICGITRREDAEAAVKAGASAVGFVFVPSSPRCVSPARAAELGRDLPVWKVGIFVNETAESVATTMRAANLDVAQIYGGEAPAGARVWDAVHLGRRDKLSRTFHPAPEALLLDGFNHRGDFDWTLAHKLGGKVIIAGGLNPSNVTEAIREAQPWGVDVSSGVESSPGVKDHSKIKQFVEAALAA